MENVSIKNQVSDILVNNGLNFRIDKLPLFAETTNENGEATKIVSPYFGLLNTKSGNIINTVKDGYCVTQNDEIVELVVRGMQNFGELTVQKAGSINDGRKTFVQLAIEGYSKVSNDVIKKYVTVIDSNDGSTGLAVGIGDLTMSCQNQFFKFYKTTQSKFRHTESLNRRILELPKLIEVALNESLKLIETYNKFASTPVSKELANQMVNYILGFDRTSSMSELTALSTKSINMMDTLYNHISKETAQKGLNLWGLHSGVTSWTTHEKSAPKRENGRIESSMLGSNYATNQLSLEFASKQLELA